MYSRTLKPQGKSVVDQSLGHRKTVEIKVGLPKKATFPWHLPRLLPGIPVLRR